MTTPTPNDWTPHHGGDCPVEGETMVEVKWNGEGFVSPATEAKEYRWSHSGDENDDIIAYRVVQVVQEQQESAGDAGAEHSGFAFPQSTELWGGLTKREYAAIHLKVPDSGSEWLDGMIVKSLRDDDARATLGGLFARPASTSLDGKKPIESFEDHARVAMAVASRAEKIRKES